MSADLVGDLRRGQARVSELEEVVGRVRALADEWVKRDCEWSCESEMLDDLHVALDGPA